MKLNQSLFFLILLIFYFIKINSKESLAEKFLKNKNEKKNLLNKNNKKIKNSIRKKSSSTSSTLSSSSISSTTTSLSSYFTTISSFSSTSILHTPSSSLSTSSNDILHSEIFSLGPFSLTSTIWNEPINSFLDKLYNENYFSFLDPSISQYTSTLIEDETYYNNSEGKVENDDEKLSNSSLFFDQLYLTEFSLTGKTSWLPISSTTSISSSSSATSSSLLPYSSDLSYGKFFSFFFIPKSSQVFYILCNTDEVELSLKSSISFSSFIVRSPSEGEEREEENDNDENKNKYDEKIKNLNEKNKKNKNYLKFYGKFYGKKNEKIIFLWKKIFSNISRKEIMEERRRERNENDIEEGEDINELDEDEELENLNDNYFQFEEYYNKYFQCKISSDYFPEIYSSTSDSSSSSFTSTSTSTPSSSNSAIIAKEKSEAKSVKSILIQDILHLSTPVLLPSLEKDREKKFSNYMHENSPYISSFNKETDTSNLRSFQASENEIGVLLSPYFSLSVYNPYNSPIRVELSLDVNLLEKANKVKKQHYGIRIAKKQLNFLSVSSVLHSLTDSSYTDSYSSSSLLCPIIKDSTEKYYNASSNLISNYNHPRVYSSQNHFYLLPGQLTQIPLEIYIEKQNFFNEFNLISKKTIKLFNDLINKKFFTTSFSSGSTTSSGTSSSVHSTSLPLPIFLPCDNSLHFNIVLMSSIGSRQVKPLNFKCRPLTLPLVYSYLRTENSLEFKIEKNKLISNDDKKKNSSSYTTFFSTSSSSTNNTSSIPISSSSPLSSSSTYISKTILNQKVPTIGSSILILPPDIHTRYVKEYRDFLLGKRNNPDLNQEEKTFYQGVDPICNEENKKSNEKFSEKNQKNINIEESKSNNEMIWKWLYPSYPLNLIISSPSNSIDSYNSLSKSIDISRKLYQIVPRKNIRYYGIEKYYTLILPYEEIDFFNSKNINKILNRSNNKDYDINYEENDEVDEDEEKENRNIILESNEKKEKREKERNYNTETLHPVVSSLFNTLEWYSFFSLLFELPSELLLPASGNPSTFGDPSLSSTHTPSTSFQEQLLFKKNRLSTFLPPLLTSKINLIGFNDSSFKSLSNSLNSLTSIHSYLLFPSISSYKLLERNNNDKTKISEEKKIFSDKSLQFLPLLFSSRYSLVKSSYLFDHPCQIPLQFNDINTLYYSLNSNKNYLLSSSSSLTYSTSSSTSRSSSTTYNKIEEHKRKFKEESEKNILKSSSSSTSSQNNLLFNEKLCQLNNKFSIKLAQNQFSNTSYHFNQILDEIILKNNQNLIDLLFLSPSSSSIWHNKLDLLFLSSVNDDYYLDFNILELFLSYQNSLSSYLLSSGSSLSYFELFDTFPNFYSWLFNGMNLENEKERILKEKNGINNFSTYFYTDEILSINKDSFYPSSSSDNSLSFTFPSPKTSYDSNSLLIAYNKITCNIYSTSPSYYSLSSTFSSSQLPFLLLDEYELTSTEFRCGLYIKKKSDNKLKSKVFLSSSSLLSSSREIELNLVNIKELILDLGFPSLFYQIKTLKINNKLINLNFLSSFYYIISSLSIYSSYLPHSLHRKNQFHDNYFLLCQYNEVNDEYNCMTKRKKNSRLEEVNLVDEEEFEEFEEFEGTIQENYININKKIEKLKNRLILLEKISKHSQNIKNNSKNESDQNNSINLDKSLNKLDFFNKYELIINDLPSISNQNQIESSIANVINKLNYYYYQHIFYSLDY